MVAGLESAEEVVAAFMRLFARSPHPDLREAADLLERKGVPRLIRRLYYAYCAEILSAIGEGVRQAIPEPVLAFGGWVASLYKEHGKGALFTLNYDVLLERLLIGEELLDLRDHLTDFFSGLPARTEVVDLLPAEVRLVGRHFYPEDPPPLRELHLHHLHGCLTHFRREADGAVLKFDSADIRDAGIYERLAHAERAEFTPSVILGSKKTAKSREWPFAFAFLELQRRAMEARTVVVAGYSFRDQAVNTRLAAAASSAQRRWIVINRKEGSEAARFRQQVLAVLGPVSPEFFLEGFDSSPARLNQ